MINCNTQATIIEVLSDCGNRVYKLKFDAPASKSACVHLNLEGHEDQKPFYLCTEVNNTVDVVVHNCSDLGRDIYYAWQPRLPGKPSACPRCKTRMDIVRTPLR